MHKRNYRDNIEQPVVAGGILIASAFTHEIPSLRPNSNKQPPPPPAFEGDIYIQYGRYYTYYLINKNNETAIIITWNFFPGVRLV